MGELFRPDVSMWGAPRPEKRVGAVTTAHDLEARLADQLEQLVRHEQGKPGFSQIVDGLNDTLAALDCAKEGTPRDSL